MNPRVKITVAASDSDHVTFLNSLNNFEEGVVSFRVRPDYNAHTGIISYDIMAAMGASEDVSGPGRKSSHNPLHMPVWLVANRITDVVVCAAESLSAEVLHDLAATAFQTRIKFWFVFDHELPEKLLKAVSEWCPEPVSPEAFETRWKGRARPEERVQADDPSDGWPRRLPEDEFPLFLAQVKAASATPVFTDYSKGPQQPFLLVRALNAAAREMGVGLITSRLKKHGGKPRNWQARHGIALEELATVPEVADA